MATILAANEANMQDDEFFNALSGRQTSQLGDTTGSRLGGRLRVLIQRTDALESSHLIQQAKAGLSSDEQALADQVWLRLTKAGLVQASGANLGASEPAVRALGTRRGVPLAERAAGWVRDTLFGSTWQRGLAVGAVGVMGVLIVVQTDRSILKPDSSGDEHLVIRGGTDMVRDKAPAARQASLKTAFEAIGASVVSVRVSTEPERWMLQVKLPDAGAVPAANRIRAEAGLPPTQATEFVLSVVHAQAR